VHFVPYQRGDSGVPLALSILQRSSAIMSLEVDFTVRSKELLCDGRMPMTSTEVDFSGFQKALWITVDYKKHCEVDYSGLQKAL
jgi:hypothetical protein